MSITLGKVLIEDGDVNNMWFQEGNVSVHRDRNDATCFTNFDGGFTQSLNDLLIAKLMEVVTGENPVMKDNDKLFIPVTQENEYWVEITQDCGTYVVEVGEPAA